MPHFCRGVLQSPPSTWLPCAPVCDASPVASSSNSSSNLDITSPDRCAGGRGVVERTGWAALKSDENALCDDDLPLLFQQCAHFRAAIRLYLCLAPPK